MKDKLLLSIICEILKDICEFELVLLLPLTRQKNKLYLILFEIEFYTMELKIHFRFCQIFLKRSFLLFEVPHYRL